MTRQLKRSSGTDAPTLGNRLLGLLPVAVLERLRSHLTPVALSARQVLFQAHAPLDVVYFPETSLVSLLTHLQDGRVLEVGLVGREGVTGISVFPGVASMPCDGIVQIAGMARCLQTAVLARELRDQSVQELFGRYAHLVLARSMQIAACNSFHRVDKRCARSLLMISDLIGGREFSLTHDALAMMLGVRRSSVTVVIDTLHRRRLIDSRRGRMTISSRAGLEKASCECYARLRDEQQRLLGF
jgi:CRP-like cAMP-binding protein